MKIGCRRVSSHHQSPGRQELMGRTGILGKASAAGRGDGPKLQERIEFAREGDILLMHSIERISAAPSILQPQRLAQEGVRDLVRVSAARVSGTAF